MFEAGKKEALFKKSFPPGRAKNFYEVAVQRRRLFKRPRQRGLKRHRRCTAHSKKFFASFFQKRSPSFPLLFMSF
jgi:hypothetical protein